MEALAPDPTRPAPTGPDPTRFVLPPAFTAELVAHAREASPDECCGFLLGRPGSLEVHSVVRAANQAGLAPEARRARYRIAPEDVFAAHGAAVERGLAIVGFYHSHPSGDATPSAHDRELAWPGSVYVIVAGERARAFVADRRGDAFRELTLVPAGGARARSPRTSSGATAGTCCCPSSARRGRRN
jgi:proteasome lid subunit RPN8/RPN11